MHVSYRRHGVEAGALFLTPSSQRVVVRRLSCGQPSPIFHLFFSFLPAAVDRSASESSPPGVCADVSVGSLILRLLTLHSRLSPSRRRVACAAVVVK